jgi:hypothetical protein
MWLGMLPIAASFGTASAQSLPARANRSGADAPGPALYETACIKALPASAFAPVTVYLAVDTPFTAEAARVRGLSRDLAERVAERIKLEFPSGSVVQPLGMAEPKLTWQGLNASLRVRAYRDGRLAWNDSLSDSLHLAGARLLASALRAVRDSSDRIAWPPGIVRDSVEFTLDLTSATLDREGRLTVPKSGNPIPVFRVMQPWIEHVARRAGGSPQYPVAAKNDGATANLMFTAVVDTTGRVDSTSVRLVAHEEQAGQAVLLLRHLDEFVRSIKSHFARTRYTPKRIGGCAVRAPFRQRFEFRLDP